MRVPVLGVGRMGRAAAWDLAITYMLAAGAIERRGVVPAELAVPLSEFVQAVKARGIDVKERWE